MGARYTAAAASTHESLLLAVAGCEKKHPAEPVPTSAHVDKPAWPGKIGRLRTALRPLLALALPLVCVPACGHLGIDLGGGGAGGTLDGMAGHSSDGSVDGNGGSDQVMPASGGVTSTGGQDSGVGGQGSGGSGSGGSETGGQASVGGETGSGGTASGGSGSGGAGGSTASGGAGSGGDGAGGSGGSSNDCAVSDELCAELEAALTHRYSFDSVGVQIADSLGGPNGQVFGTTLNGSGELTFANENQYATLPPGILAGSESASIEAWFVWEGGEQWQKVFEFGTQNMLGNPTSYIYVSPEGGGGIILEHALAAGIRLQAGGDRQLRTTNVTTIGVLTHVVLVADSVMNRIVLYKNGAWVGQRDATVDIGLLAANNNRLGRSLFPDDPGFIGTISELRIYGEVLSADAIAKSYDAGPDASFGP